MSAATAVRAGRVLWLMSYSKPCLSWYLQGPYLVLYKTVVGPYGSTPQHCNDLADKVLSLGLVHKSEHGEFALHTTTLKSHIASSACLC